MAKLAILLGCIAVLFGLFLCFDSFANGGLMWNFFAVLGICLVPFGAYIAVVNYRIMREETN
ncbi:hypothetical protein [Vibrio mediterranei]|uniref:hypothetical protein n=1 Tax=Vibrio mediterranei TaxID=689 RepID=UPI001EFDED36|nr:hypothetical protein [Vibrio mediterranei]MCG9657622.1 hypothetical protein [Vibrio mediterranei]